MIRKGKSKAISNGITVGDKRLTGFRCLTEHKAKKPTRINGEGCVWENILCVVVVDFFFGSKCQL